MGLVSGGHDEVRAYLDSAVAEAAERWVGRATDATAYADLVAAVLARREALSPMAHLPERYDADPVPVRPGPPRHHERRARPRWPLGSGGPMPSSSPGTQAFSRSGSSSAPLNPTPINPTSSPAPVGAAGSAPLPEAASGSALPTRPPGRHRTPVQPSETAPAIDLSDNLTTVLDWLGRPDA